MHRVFRDCKVPRVHLEVKVNKAQLERLVELVSRAQLVHRELLVVVFGLIAEILFFQTA